MDKIDELLTRRIDQALPSKKALEKRLRSGKKIRLYQGFDPSSPNLHIGHLVGLLTMKQFQDLGHEVIFLIGDFTGRVGDPTGKSKTRKVLTEKQVNKNAQTYQEQAGMVLNFKGKNPVVIRKNSEWWLNDINPAQILQIAGQLTVQQLIERDMFQDRLKKDQPIHLNEFLYPILQGYDSVMMDIDLEIGGTDQLFNMMVGRSLVKTFLDKQKFVVTTKLLADSKGKKIGKTEGNAINIKSSPNDLFGQIMSLPDDAILPCLRLATTAPMSLVNQAKKEVKNEPLKWKKRLGFELVKMLHSPKVAQLAQDSFEKVFQKGKKPQKVPVFKVAKSDSIVEVLHTSGLVKSKSQVKRLVNQGAVSINQVKVSSPTAQVKPGDLIKCGKHRFLKIE